MEKLIKYIKENKEYLSPEELLKATELLQELKKGIDDEEDDGRSRSRFDDDNYGKDDDSMFSFGGDSRDSDNDNDEDRSDLHEINMSDNEDTDNMSAEELMAHYGLNTPDHPTDHKEPSENAPLKHEDIKRPIDKMAEVEDLKQNRWKPSKDYGKNQSKIDDMVKKGFTPAEAHHYHNIDGITDFSQALGGKFSDPHISKKKQDILMEYAKNYVKNADKINMKYADSEKNPDLYATGKMLASIDEIKPHYEKMRKNHIEENKGKSLFDRFNAHNKFENDYEHANPHFHQSWGGVTDQHALFDAAEQQKQKTSQNIKEIFSGKQAQGGDSEMAANMREGMEDVGTQAGIKTNPINSFVNQNQKEISQASEKYKEKKYKPSSLMTHERIDNLVNIGIFTPEKAERFRQVLVQKGKLGERTANTDSTPKDSEISKPQSQPTTPGSSTPRTILRRK